MRAAHAFPLLSMLLTAVACEQRRFAEPVDATAVAWTPYRSERLGVEFRYPSTWQTREGGDGIALRDAHATAMRLTVADRAEAKHRGLWGRTPAVRIDTIGDLSFAFYRYDHYDGPFYVPTLAFVVPHRNGELGIEFRTRAPDLDEAQRRILASVRLF